MACRTWAAFRWKAPDFHVRAISRKLYTYIFDLWYDVVEFSACRNKMDFDTTALSAAAAQ